MGGVYTPGQVEGVCRCGVYSRPSRGCVWVGCIFQAKYGVCVDGMYITGQVEGMFGWDAYSRSGRGCVWVGCIFQAR